MGTLGTFTIPELSMIAIAWEVTHPNGFSAMVALRFNDIQRIQETTNGYNLGTRMYSTTLLLPKGTYTINLYGDGDNEGGARVNQQTISIYLLHTIG